MPNGVTAPKGVKNFPQACARLLLSRTKLHPARALDLGCAVGRASFELAGRVPEVVGIDYSRTFIQTATQLQKLGKIQFRIVEEGKFFKPCTARIPNAIQRERVQFLHGDALHLPHHLGSFDLVLAANLVDRLPNPAKFLKSILPDLVNPGGLVLLTSPYTWSTDFTPRTKWLHDSFSHIRQLLRPHFGLLHRQNLPFLLREHRRKFQYTFADATLWQRS